jgi:hypothetical protein
MRSFFCSWVDSSSYPSLHLLIYPHTTVHLHFAMFHLFWGEVVRWHLIQGYRVPLFCSQVFRKQHIVDGSFVQLHTSGGVTGFNCSDLKAQELVRLLLYWGQGTRFLADMWRNWLRWAGVIHDPPNGEMFKDSK